MAKTLRERWPTPLPVCADDGRDTEARADNNPGPGQDRGSGTSRPHGARGGRGGNAGRSGCGGSGAASGPARGRLYPDFDAREVRAGVLRAPDVEIRNVNGVPHVVARLGQGTSLFDRQGVFGHKHWQHVEIPQGTVIPQGLIITRDDYNPKYDATHHSISPNFTMPKATFMQLLDQLARNALTAQRKQGNG